MAEKKKTEKVEKEEELKVETPEEPKEISEYVEIELFADNDKYKDPLFVGVNGETCLIQRGVPVKVKRKFVEVIRNSEAQDRRTAIIIRELTSKSNSAELQ